MLNFILFLLSLVKQFLISHSICEERMVYFSAICAIAITCIACCVKRFMRKKRESDLEKKEAKGKNGVDLKVCKIEVNFHTFNCESIF